jgi:hypothetical protein
MSNDVRILGWRPVHKNSLRGFVSARLPSGMVVHDISIHVHDSGKRWAGPPSKPQINKDGVALRDDRGKVKYVPIIEFDPKPLRDKFSDAIVDALLREHPDALDGGAA